MIGLSINTINNSIRLVQDSCSCMSSYMGLYPDMISTVHLQYSLAVTQKFSEHI